MKKSFLLLTLFLLVSLVTSVFGQENSNEQTDLSGWMLPKGKYKAWNMKYQLYDIDAEEPANDMNGNSWKDLSFDDSSWQMLTGPLGREASDSINSNYSWEGDHKAFYLRRTFNLTSIPSENVVLHLLQDDAVKIYINGILVTEVPSHQSDWLTFSINSNVFVKGSNILAIKFTTETVPDYLDYGIFGGNAVEEDDFPKLNISASKSTLSEGETFELTIKADSAPDTPTTLMLTCDHSVRFDFPSRLTLPAGETTVSTTVTVIDDHDIAETLSAAFTVSAADYGSGEAIVLVNDDDMPHIELVLAPTAVSANAGSNAIMGTIKRSDNLNSKVTVVLSDDTEGLLTYSPQQVTLERSATEAHFTISPKGTISIDREVNITAAVYVKTCDCPAGAQSGGSTTQKLTLLAGEGSALNIEPLATDFSIDSNDNGILITIVSPLQDFLSVNVTSNFDEYLDYPHSVEIPAGDTSISIPVKKKGEGGISEGQVITFTATAAGYATAACWMISTESSLPDAVITSFEVNATEAEAGSEVELTVVVKNVGSGQLSEETPVKINLSDGSYPVMLKTGTVLSSGESTTLTTNYQLPSLTGNYSFLATVNPSGKIKEAVTSNNMSQEIPITINPNFHATAVIDKTTYGQGEIITVTGKANGTKSVFVDVEVYFINDDMRQTVTAKTDAEGNYTAIFLPLDGTSGHFVIGACFPGEGKTDAMAEANVFGLTTASHRTTCQFSQGGSYSGVITISNPGDLPQTGVRVELQDVPEGCVFSFPVINKIEAGQTLDLSYTINSVGNDVTAGQKRMNVSIKSNEGALTEHAIDYSIDPAKGCLKTDSTSITMTMTLGVAREFPITIWNEGMAPTGTISLTLPDWIESVTPQQLPSLASGDSVTVILRIVPKDNMYLNIPKTGRIGMNCSDGTGLSLSLEVTPVSEQNGTFTIDVIDEFTYCTEEKPHVSGAKVQVVNRSTQAVVAEGVTNGDGKFTANIPEGWYRLKITADYHESYDEYLLVDPGTNKTKRIFISFNGITTEWKVEETDVEDEYSMETVLKFETQVPPPYIDVVWPDEKPQLGKYYPVTIVNRGLIDFYDVKANLRISSNKYGLEVIGNPEIDTLSAGQAVVFYTKLTLKNNPNLARGGGGEGTQVSSFNDCEELIADLKACYICGEPVEKFFKLILLLGRCGQRNNSQSNYGDGSGGSSSSSSGGDDGSGDDIPEESEEIACDLPKFKIVTVDGGDVVRGVACDGLSQVKIVLDGVYENEVNNIKWEIVGGNNFGKLENPGDFNAVIYTAPASFPGNNETVYKVQLNLTCSIGRLPIQTIEKAVEVELIRVPVLMVHGLNSNGDDCWKRDGTSKGLYEFLMGLPANLLGRTNLYNKYAIRYKPFQLFTLDYEDSHNDHFDENYPIITNGILHLIKEAKKKKYVAKKIDVVAHSMGGLLTKLYIKNFPFTKGLINKVITINTPHGGSQLGNFMNDPKLQFVRDIVSEINYSYPFPEAKAKHSAIRGALKWLYYTFSPSGKRDINDGAVYDLGVEGDAIGDDIVDAIGNAIKEINDEHINNYTKDVKCHAIVTSTIAGQDWKIKLAEAILSVSEAIGYTTVQSFIDDVYNNDASDLIVPVQSQKGGLSERGLTVFPTGNWSFMHTESCHNSFVQQEILRLLNSSDENDFAMGFQQAKDINNKSLVYKMEGFTWDKILDIYPANDLFNFEDLYNKYSKYNKTVFDNWKEKRNEKSKKTRNMENEDASSYLALDYNFLEGDTIINLRVKPIGDFSNISIGCFYNDELLTIVKADEGTVRLPNKIQGDIFVIYEGQRSDGSWCGMSKTINVNTIGTSTIKNLSFVEDSVLIIDNEFFRPNVLCIWSDGIVTKVDNPTLSVTNGNLAYIENNKYVYGKNSGHTTLVATYGGLTCSTPLEVYFTDDNTESTEEGNNGSGNSPKSVCSTVTISFKNKSVMTRQGFRGTLTINNNHPSLPLQNLRLHLEVRDEEGKMATQHEFQINPESLTGDFTGELDFDTGWDLKNGGTGVATILFIPTKNAAPSEPKRWSFGGTISYTDPFTGLVVTHSLKSVTLTVNPTPVLDFTYFMQRDVYANDPQTDAKERSIPAEFALLINNKGNADAKDLKFVCKEPVIIDNEKNLKINFSIVSSQLNGENKTIALSSGVPIEFGTVSASSQAYAQWWLKSPVLGHFTEYDVTFDHKTSFGNEELSLIDQVSIHELIHGFTPLSTEQNDSKRAFLVNDTEDAQDMPDRIYFTNATQQEVTIASEVSISRQNGNYSFTVIPSQQGWTYAQILNPAINGNVQVVRITRQNGMDIPADNIWLTEKTLPDGAVGHPERKLHFIGDVMEGGEQFVIEFDCQPDEDLEVEYYEGVPAEDVEYNGALSEVTIHFNKSINDASFTVDDLTLYHEGVKVDISAATITKIDGQTFKLNLGTTTSQEGYYALMVNTQEITDIDGYEGVLSKEASWVQKEYEEPSVSIEVTDISQLTDAIYVAPFFARVGYDVEMAVCLKNAQPATAYMFDLVLPKGITVATDTDGKYIETLSGRHDDHSRLINYRGDNTYTISTFSGNSEELKGNDGAIRLLTLHVGKDMAEGMYAVNIKKASYSKPNGTLVKMRDTTSSVTVEDYVLGDVNADGKIDIGDVVCIINHQMGNENTKFVERAADVNKDGTVDISDADTIVDFLLGKTASLSR